VAVEAQMMAKPVIATALGGSNETVENGKTGWLIEPDSPQALANALANALTHKDRLASMGQRARTWALAHFTTQACCANEFNAYKKLFNKKQVKIK
jgi:glycosyltransferase involved in cell wall biosynthesis